MKMQMKLNQQLIMTPQLQQAIKLLQLSHTELEELIEQTLVENPGFPPKFARSIPQVPYGTVEAV